MSAMELRRLAWAGLEIHTGGKILVIDLVEDFARLHGKNARPRRPRLRHHRRRLTSVF
jgi:hypothetical protein